MNIQIGAWQQSSFERLYESLIIDRCDHLALNELFVYLKSDVPEIRWASTDTLRDFKLEPGVIYRKR